MNETMKSAIPIIFLNIIWGFLVSIQLPFFPIEVRTINWAKSNRPSTIYAWHCKSIQITNIFLLKI